MALKALLTKEEHAKLSEALRGEYAETKDGRFVLAVEGVGGLALEDVGSLKTALAEEREKHRKTAAIVTAFEGLDPDAARKALSKVDEMKNWKPDDKVREMVDAQVGQVKSKYETELKSKTDREAFLSGAIRKRVVDSEVHRVLSGKGSAKLILPAIRDRIRVDESNGDFVPVVLDDRGNPMISRKSGSTDPMGLEEYVLGLKSDPDFANAFYGTGSSGPGATGNSGGGGGGGYRLTASQAKDRPTFQRAEKAAQAAGAQLQIVPD